MRLQTTTRRAPAPPLAGAAAAPRPAIEANERSPISARARFNVWLLVFAVPAVLLLLILWVIWFHTPNIPWWDEWSTAFLVQHANQGTLTWQELWAPHYFRHRIVVPRLLDLGMIELTHWNRQVEMTVDLGLAVAYAALLFACVRRTVRSRTLSFVLVVPVSLLLFSLGQDENWLAPFQVAFIATIFGLVLSLWALADERAGWGRFALAIAGALIATFSSAAGLMVWVTLLPSLWRAGYRRLAVWIVAGLVTWIAYFIGFPHHAVNPDIIQGIEFMLAYLGGPIGYPNPALAQIFGMVGLGLLCANLYLYWRRHGSLWPVVVWIDLALFGLATAVLTAAGRTPTGGDPSPGAIISHYQIFAAVWWVAPIVLSALSIQDAARQLDIGQLARAMRGAVLTAPARRAWMVASANVLVLLVVCVGAVLVSREGLREGLAWQDSLRANEGCVIQQEVANDACLARWMLVTDKVAILQEVTYLRQQHLAIFYSDNPGGR